MRHAILITAYTDFIQLINLVKMFDYRFDIYIHIDKKANISDTYFNLLRSLPHVKVVDCIYCKLGRSQPYRCDIVALSRGVK